MRIFFTRLALPPLIFLYLFGFSSFANPSVYARPSAVTLTQCYEGNLRTAIQQAGPGGTVIFACSGYISLSQTLLITQNLILDGSRGVVTIGGRGHVQVFSVNTRVNLTISHLTVKDGSAQGGGGMSNRGNTLIIDSTFENNQASVDGGAIENIMGGRLAIDDSTLAFNSSTSGYAGAIYTTGGALSISNSTIASNSATGNTGGFVGGGAIYSAKSNFPTKITIEGSIIARNTAPSFPNCAGAKFGNRGYNLEDGTNCGFTGLTNQQNTHPHLASALSYGGGQTETFALLPGSPAINQIPFLGDSNCVLGGTDQRGKPRPGTLLTTGLDGLFCDKGAYETQGKVL